MAVQKKLYSQLMRRWLLQVVQRRRWKWLVRKDDPFDLVAEIKNWLSPQVEVVENPLKTVGSEHFSALVEDLGIKEGHPVLPKVANLISNLFQVRLADTKVKDRFAKSERPKNISKKHR